MNSRLVLQIAVAVGGLVPVSAGLAGVLLGPGITGDTASIDLDSHLRYLSGLLLAVGLAFWSTIPAIENQRRPFLMLTCIVVTGGIGRLVGVLAHGMPSAPMLFGLAMELGITPALCFWQRRVADGR